MIAAHPLRHIEEDDKNPSSFFQKPVLRFLIIGFLFITAFGIRLYHINEPLLDFHPIRQYRSAIVARAFYFDDMKSIPEWRRDIAIKNMQKQRPLEPQVMERLIAFAYRIAGGEHLWIPRVLSSIYWLIGGMFLYLIAQKTISVNAAIFSTAFYLFLPFGISMSRSFQPDSMMIMLLLLSIFAILWYDERRSMSRLVIAALVSSAAIFIKPVCVFLLFGGLISIGVYRQGIRKSLINRHLPVFTVISLLPAVIYIFNAKFLLTQSQISFIPGLIIKPFFWKEWLTMIGHVVGYIAFAAAFAGLLMFPKGLAKALLIGLWIGYFAFGLAFNTRISTHDYYTAIFIPVAALSLGPLGVSAVRGIGRVFRRWRGAVVASGIFLLMVLLAAGLYMRNIHWREIAPDVKDKLQTVGAVIGVNPQFIKFVKPDLQRDVRIAEEIGKIVNHSTKTLILAADYGNSLVYLGELSGFPWPTTGFFSTVRRWGKRVIGAKERFNDTGRGILTEEDEYLDPSLLIKQSDLEYFIVTDLQDYRKQPDLVEFLTGNFPILVQTDEYLIFDLRNRVGTDKRPGNKS